MGETEHFVGHFDLQDAALVQSPTPFTHLPFTPTSEHFQEISLGMEIGETLEQC